MKNLLRRVPRALAAVSFAIILIAATPTIFCASPPSGARITQLANDVKILPSDGKARAAAINDSVTEGTVMRTGADSRAELTLADGTLARFGSSSNLRMSSGRTLELGGGSMLLHVAKNSGTLSVETDFVNLATSGATVAFEVMHSPEASHSAASAGARYRVSVLEGEVELQNAKRSGEPMKLSAKQAAIGSADSVPQVVRFDVADWMQRNDLITAFRPLPPGVLALLGTPASGSTFAALFRSAGADASSMGGAGFGTINPANLSGGGGNEVSPSEERQTICHNGQTLTLPRDAAEKHLRNHPGDSAGACR